MNRAEVLNKDYLGVLDNKERLRAEELEVEKEIYDLSQKGFGIKEKIERLMRINIEYESANRELERIANEIIKLTKSRT